MKRLAILLALCAACGDDTATPTTTGHLDAPIALALADGPKGNERLFIANAAGGDLKVLDLAPKVRFVAAPAKVAALSVLGPERPQEMVSARGLVGDTVRRIVFVVGAGSQVWAVDAQSDTPVASRPLDAGSELGLGPLATISIAAIPYVTGQPPRVVVGLVGPGTRMVVPVRWTGAALQLDGGGATDLDAEPGSLAVTASDAAPDPVVFVGDSASDDVLVAPLSGGARRRIAGVGGPVVRLAAQGRWMFAALAGGGLRPIDLAAGAMVPSDPVNPALPWPKIEIPGLVNGMAFAPKPVDVRVGSVTATIPVALAVASSDGRIYWVDASASESGADLRRLRIVNADADAPNGPTAGAPALIGPDGAALATGHALQVDALSFGVSRSETWRAIWEGVIPTAAGRTALVDATSDTLSLIDEGVVDLATELALPANQQDLVIELAEPPCAQVSAVEYTATRPVSGNRLTATPVSGTLAVANCRRVVRYSLRPKNAWVVAGTVSGFAGVIADGDSESFTFAGERFFVPDVPSAAPALSLTLTRPAGATVARGAAFLFDVRSAVSPTFVGVNRAGGIIDPFQYATGLVIRESTLEVFAAMAGTDRVLRFLPNQGDLDVTPYQ